MLNTWSSLKGIPLQNTCCARLLKKWNVQGHEILRLQAKCDLSFFDLSFSSICFGGEFPNYVSWKFLSFSIKLPLVIRRISCGLVKGVSAVASSMPFSSFHYWTRKNANHSLAAHGAFSLLHRPQAKGGQVSVATYQKKGPTQEFHSTCMNSLLQHWKFDLELHCTCMAGSAFLNLSSGFIGPCHSTIFNDTCLHTSRKW